MQKFHDYDIGHFIAFVKVNSLSITCILQVGFKFDSWYFFFPLRFAFQSQAEWTATQRRVTKHNLGQSNGR